MLVSSNGGIYEARQGASFSLGRKIAPYDNMRVIYQILVLNAVDFSSSF